MPEITNDVLLDDYTNIKPESTESTDLEPLFHFDTSPKCITLCRTKRTGTLPMNVKIEVNELGSGCKVWLDDNAVSFQNLEDAQA